MDGMVILSMKKAGGLFSGRHVRRGLDTLSGEISGESEDSSKCVLPLLGFLSTSKEYGKYAYSTKCGFSFLRVQPDLGRGVYLS
jgi:hypothetical protein